MSQSTEEADAESNKDVQITLSIDAMGGDLGPAVVIAGMKRASKKLPHLRYVVHGPKKVLRPLVKKHKLSSKCVIVDAGEVVSMDDKPSHVMRNGKGTSMWSAINSVRSGDASVCVSCGNTGALMAVSMLRLRKLPGVARPAIAVLWPSRNPSGFNVMLDVGADVRAEAKDLLNYAAMGVSYARNGFDMKIPRVGLLNVGTEESKGHTVLHEASELLTASQADLGCDFIGFVEGNDIPSNKVDVIVSDGFSGNIALKSAEGTAGFIREILKASFGHSLLSRLASVLAYTSLRRLAKRIDPRRVNGGVFLGLNGTVVKSHGSADATGVAAAIKLAYRLAEVDFGDRLANRVLQANQNVDTTRHKANEA